MRLRILRIDHAFDNSDNLGFVAAEPGGQDGPTAGEALGSSGGIGLLLVIVLVLWMLGVF